MDSDNENTGIRTRQKITSQPKSSSLTSLSSTPTTTFVSFYQILVTLWQELRRILSSPLEIFLIPIMLTLVVIWLYFGSAHAFLVLTKKLNLLQSNPFLDWYQYLYYHINTLLILGIVPILVLKYGFKFSLDKMGVQFGNWRFGLPYLLLTMIIMTPLVWFSSLSPNMRKEYPLTKLAASFPPLSWILWELTYLLYYIGWEIFHRGALLLILKDTTLGLQGAMAYQIAISTLIHLSAGMKPFIEIFSAISGGYLFGIGALQTNSILWPMLLHWYMGILTDVLAFYGN